MKLRDVTYWRLMADEWPRPYWLLSLRCGCNIRRPAKAGYGCIKSPPMKAKCECAPGCRYWPSLGCSSNSLHLRHARRLRELRG